MGELVFIIFLIHGTLMLVDEFVFHRKREMPEWERKGHPLDTLTVFIPMAMIWFAAPTSNLQTLYIILAVFSSIFVTKDEWVHRQYCEPAECYLHAFLFLLHPLIFYSAWLVWPDLHSSEGNPYIPIAFMLVLLSILGFGLYQLIFWNVFEPAKKQGKDFY